MAQDVAVADTFDGASQLSAEELSIVLRALWAWRGQLGDVCSRTPVPGLVSNEATRGVDELARKLGADPDAYLYGLKQSRRR
jgi:hypothetical protein